MFQLLELEIGASEGIRTLDPHVGNVMLYQAELRSLPFKRGQNNGTILDCKPSFLFIPGARAVMLAR